MASKLNPKAFALIRSVAVLQLKLLLGAGRDLILSPITLAAACIDLVMLKHRDPSLFRTALKLGEHSDRYIDTWRDASDPEAPPRENVDALLARIEEVVRDPQTGARRARILKRWAERQAARARQRAVSEISSRLPVVTTRPPSDPSA